MIDIIYYVFSVLAVIVFIYSIQLKNKKDILLAQVFANVFYAISYFFINAFSAGSMNLVSSCRAFSFYRYDKTKQKTPFFLLLLYILLIVLLTFFTYNEIISLIPPFITILYFISSYYENPKVIRIVFLICAFIWIYYNISVEAYIALIGNAFEVTSGIIALKRFKNARK